MPHSISGRCAIEQVEPEGEEVVGLRGELERKAEALSYLAAEPRYAVCARERVDDTAGPLAITARGRRRVMADDARRLPTGAHGIPADVVARNQRERLVAAVAEACAESGYAETSVADLAHRAGVSTATFYKLFAGKLECALEAHRELLGRLLEEVDRACVAEGEWGAKVRAGAHALLSLLAADPPTTRLLTVEVLALGPEGAERNDAAIEAFAARLRVGREAGGDSSFPNADWTLVAGISALIGKRVMASEAVGLLELEDELVAMVTALR